MLKRGQFFVFVAIAGSPYILPHDTRHPKPETRELASERRILLAFLFIATLEPNHYYIYIYTVTSPLPTHPLFHPPPPPHQPPLGPDVDSPGCQSVQPVPVSPGCSTTKTFFLLILPWTTQNLARLLLVSLYINPCVGISSAKRQNGLWSQSRLTGEA